eukprot:10236874-Alexandrium_andersonii.AAC.1
MLRPRASRHSSERCRTALMSFFASKIDVSAAGRVLDVNCWYLATSKRRASSSSPPSTARRRAPCAP